jgi:hypothetical protein
MSPDYLQALELARDGEWDKAHELVQAHEEPTAYLIHGYLHRVEGDLGNAGYWYRLAGEPMPDNTLAEEWDRLYAQVNAAS